MSSNEGIREATSAHSDYSTDPVEALLLKLEGVKSAGAGWTARCPAHDDRHNSLCIARGHDGRALIDCKAGCAPSAILARLGIEWPDLFAARGKGRARAGTPRASSISGDSTSTGQHQEVREKAVGCTVAEYAAEKSLPEGFLEELGLRDSRYQGQPCIRIPYFDEIGAEIATRYRTALRKTEGDDNRFKWKLSSKPCLYGLWRLEAARKAGYVVLCEGESDAQTLWHHAIPALGIPGANSWREQWASYLEGIPRIYVIIEPDKGGDAVRAWLAKSDIRERTFVIELGDFKDPSGLYLHSPKSFKAAWDAALEAAISWSDLEKDEIRAKASEAWETCRELTLEPDILSKFAGVLAARGVVGEVRAAKLVYLIMTSRLLAKPVSAAIKGPSSAGKSFTVEQTLAFFPPTAYYALSAMSERALAYSQEPLAHRIMVIFEAAGLSGEVGSYLMRSLLSEGQVRYETVDKMRDGLKARLIEREGPTGLLVTTTSVSLHPENETRLLSIPVTDTPDQTRLVLLALAGEHEADSDKMGPEWIALQDWLAGAEHDVTIPYAGWLAANAWAGAVRLRRDFLTMLNLVRTHAMLHQATREKDEHGRIIASPEDYAAVHALIADLVSEGVEATVPKTVRETVSAVKEIYTETGATVGVGQLARHMKLDKGAVSRRAKLCLDRGYLRNLEIMKGRAYKLEAGDDLPEDRVVLPLPEDLRRQWQCRREPDAPVDNEECCTVDTSAEGTTAISHNGLHARERAGWEEIPPDKPVSGPGVYHFDPDSGRAFRKVAFG